MSSNNWPLPPSNPGGTWYGGQSANPSGSQSGSGGPLPSHSGKVTNATSHVLATGQGGPLPGHQQPQLPPGGWHGGGVPLPFKPQQPQPPSIQISTVSHPAPHPSAYKQPAPVSHQQTTTTITSFTTTSTSKPTHPPGYPTPGHAKISGGLSNDGNSRFGVGNGLSNDGNTRFGVGNRKL